MRRLGDPWFNRLGGRGYPWGGGAGGGAVRYLLLARFNAADQGYADAQVLDSAALGVEIGQLTVVEVDGTLAIVSNKMDFTAQATAVQGDLGVFSTAKTKSLGMALLGIARFTAPIAALDIHQILWSNVNDVPSNVNTEIVYGLTLSSADLYYRTLSAVALLNALSSATDYQHAIVLGGYDSNGIPWRSGETPANYLYGAAFYIQGGAFADWTLIWRAQANNTSTLYAGVSNMDTVGTIDDLRVPDVDLSAVLQPNNLSLFTAANGTSLDAITPEVGGVWTEQNGDWDIQSNQAENNAVAASNYWATIDAGISDCMIDCNVTIAAADAGLARVVVRFLDTSNSWIVDLHSGADLFRIREYNAGVFTTRASTAFVVNNSTSYDLRAIADGQTIDGFVDGGDKISYGAASFNETETEHGIGEYIEAGVADFNQFDNFAVYPRTSATYDTELDGV